MGGFWEWTRTKENATNNTPEIEQDNNCVDINCITQPFFYLCRESRPSTAV